MFIDSNGLIYDGQIKLGDREATIDEINAYKSSIELTCTGYQFRQALNSMGLRQIVENIIANGSQELKDAWQFKTEYRRNHPDVLSVQKLANKTDAEIDQLFILASTFNG